MRFGLTTFGIIAACLFIASCSQTDSGTRGPQIQATLQSALPDNEGDGINLGNLLALADNAPQMSCIELTVGSLRATGLNAVSDSRIVKADTATRIVAGSVGSVAKQKIDKELECHCDRGQPMPGYEKWEKRSHLIKSRTNRTLKPQLMSLYPRDENGNPRFLRIGEPLEESIIAQLPPVPTPARFDDCGRQCKAARARMNAAAIAEGKPEPWPNLQPPRKAQCSAA